MKRVVHHKKTLLVEAVILFLVVSLFIYFFRNQWNPHNVSSFVGNLKEQYGIVSYLVFIGIVFITSVLSIPMLPILAVLSGVLFGYLGIIPYMIGFTMGNLVPFLLSKYFLSQWFSKKFERALSRFEGKKEQEKMGTYHFMLRLMPGPPAFLTSVFAGIQNISLSSFLIAVILGTIPKTFVYLLAGNMIEGENSIQYNSSFFIMMVLLFALSLLPILLPYCKDRKRKAKDENQVL